jgi:hypothetical protein
MHCLSSSALVLSRQRPCWLRERQFFTSRWVLLFGRQLALELSDDPGPVPDGVAAMVTPSVNHYPACTAAVYSFHSIPLPRAVGGRHRCAAAPPPRVRRRMLGFASPNRQFGFDYAGDQIGRRRSPSKPSIVLSCAGAGRSATTVGQPQYLRSLTPHHGLSAPAPCNLVGILLHKIIDCNSTYDTNDCN